MLNTEIEKVLKILNVINDFLEIDVDFIIKNNSEFKVFADKFITENFDKTKNFDFNKSINLLKFLNKIQKYHSDIETMREDKHFHFSPEVFNHNEFLKYDYDIFKDR